MSDLADRLRDALADDARPAEGGSARERLGRLAVLHQRVTLDQLNEALAEQQLQASRGETPEKLGRILVRKGWLDEGALERLLEVQARGTLPAPRLKRYEIRERLGEGALAVVYRALDRELGRPVAIKVLKESALLHDAARERLRREAHALARLAHPNVVAVHEFGEEGGHIYIVIELVQGRTLRRILESRPSEIRPLLESLARVADGIHHAHEHGIVHRDLKPENILVADSGEPKVADFGLAHLAESELALTLTGAKQGTPLYMAPEQVEGRSREVTAATDVYALGAILYETLAGSPPFTGESLAAIFSRILSEEPTPPRKLVKGVPADLETIALKALSKDPARRYPSARALADDLRRHLSGEPILARPAGFPSKVLRRVRKNPVAAVLAAGILVTAGVAVFVGLSSADRARLAEENRVVARETIRSAARVSLDAALGFRRLGANDRMAQSLPALEEAYRRAVELAPDLAEVDYLMGRMYRALMQHAKALEFQEQALRKDPHFLPALYERVILVSRTYGSQVRNTNFIFPLPEGAPVTAEASRKTSKPTVDEIEREQPDLARTRDRLFRDCELLERLVRDGRTPSNWPVPISEANLLAIRGVVSYHRGEFAKATELLTEAVRQDPLLEDAWELLAKGTSEKPAENIQEKRKLWEEAVRLYSEGLARDRGYVPHLLGRAEVLHVRGDDRMCRGEDPLSDFAASEQDLSEAMRLRKSSPTLRGRGDLRTSRGVFRISRGADPRPDFAQAEEDYEEALRTSQAPTSILRRRGTLRTHSAAYRRQKGEDPLPDLKGAEQDLTAALSKGAKDGIAWDWRGVVKARRGHWRLDRGEDPTADFDAAEADLTESIRLFPMYPNAWRNRGDVRRLRGVYRAAKGLDPSDDFRSADEDLTEGIRRSEARPSHPGWLTSEFLPGWTARGRLKTDLARHRLGRGEDPLAEFASAEKDFGEALRFNRSDPDAYAARGLMRSLKAAYLEKAGRKTTAANDFRNAANDFQQAIRLKAALEADLARALASARENAERLGK